MNTVRRAPSFFALTVISQLLLVLWPATVRAQQRNATVSGTATQAPATSVSSLSQRSDAMQFGLGDGPIQPGDIVDVQVFDAPEMSFRTQVSSAGDIAVPLLGTYHIAGLSTIEAAKSLTNRLVKAALLVHPQVSVLVQQFGKGITVLGQVKNPGIFRVGSNRTVADLLALAGGATDRSGHLLRVYNPGDAANAALLHWDPSLRQNLDVDTALKDGQVLEVSTCGIIYVGGNVGRPGAYSLCDSRRTSIAQAIALAGGEKPSSKENSAILIHEQADGKRVVQTLRLGDILNSKVADPTMEADDILYIPTSALKAGAKIAAQAAIGFASQAFVYSVQR